MAHKKQLTTITVVAFLGVLIGVFALCQPDQNLICRGSDFGKLNFILPLLSITIILSVSPLFFLKEAVYLTWKKFAVWALPIMAILIALTPTRAPGAYFSLGIDRKYVTITVSIFFVVISYVLIGIVSLKKKK